MKQGIAGVLDIEGDDAELLQQTRAARSAATPHQPGFWQKSWTWRATRL